MAKQFDKVFTIHYRDYIGDVRYPLKMQEVVRQYVVFGDTEKNVRARFLDTPGFYGYENRIVKIESEPIASSNRVIGFIM